MNCRNQTLQNSISSRMSRRNKITKSITIANMTKTRSKSIAYYAHCYHYTKLLDKSETNYGKYSSVSLASGCTLRSYPGPVDHNYSDKLLLAIKIRDTRAIHRHCSKLTISSGSSMEYKLLCSGEKCL